MSKKNKNKNKIKIMERTISAQEDVILLLSGHIAACLSINKQFLQMLKDKRISNLSIEEIIQIDKEIDSLNNEHLLNFVHERENIYEKHGLF